MASDTASMATSKRARTAEGSRGIWRRVSLRVMWVSGTWKMIVAVGRLRVDELRRLN